MSKMLDLFVGLCFDAEAPSATAARPEVGAAAGAMAGAEVRLSAPVPVAVPLPVARSTFTEISLLGEAAGAASIAVGSRRVGAEIIASSALGASASLMASGLCGCCGVTHGMCVLCNGDHHADFCPQNKPCPALQVARSRCSNSPTPKRRRRAVEAFAAACFKASPAALRRPQRASRQPRL